VETVYVELRGLDHLDWTWAVLSPWLLAFLDRHLDVAR